MYLIIDDDNNKMSNNNSMYNNNLSNNNNSWKQPSRQKRVLNVPPIHYCRFRTSEIEYLQTENTHLKGSITVRLTFYLFCLGLAALLLFYLFGQIQTSQTGSQPYRYTGECSLDNTLLPPK